MNQPNPANIRRKIRIYEVKKRAFSQLIEMNDTNLFTCEFVDSNDQTWRHLLST